MTTRQSKNPTPFDPNEEIGNGTTTLDYLKVRYAWLGELIDETTAELKRLQTENAQYREHYVTRTSYQALEAENAKLHTMLNAAKAVRP